MNIKYFLKPEYSTRKSFYNKAIVEQTDNSIILYSYDTKVAEISDSGIISIYYIDSATTLRHIKEFLLQNIWRFSNEKYKKLIKYNFRKKELAEIYHGQYDTSIF